MNEQDKEEAKELAERAGTQAKNAAKNSGRAIRAVAEPAAEAASEKVEDVADDVKDTARRVNIGVLGRISSDTGVGFLALSVSIYSGLIAYTKFRQAVAGRSDVIT